jgi:spore germination protein KA
MVMQNNDKVSPKLAENIETLKRIFHAEKNRDFIGRAFTAESGRAYYAACIDGMVSRADIGELIIRPLQLSREQSRPAKELVRTISTRVSDDFETIAAAVLSGICAVFEDGSASCTLCETIGFFSRGVSTPMTESVIKGSQEGFTEPIRTNITMIRRIIQSRELVTEFFSVGGINKGLCAVVYLDNLANPELIEKVRERLKGISGDFIMGTGMVEQLIEDRPFSLFPSILSTERPDRAAYQLSQGRIAILVDGSPFAMIVPVTLAVLLDSPESHAQRWTSGTFTRLIRLFALFCAVMLSGLYLALVLYSREMIPAPLLGSLIAARAGIPLPSVFEVLMMELFFELVREGGVRSPASLGGAIGIVGALILGQSAVSANLVSPVTLIVVALSGVGNIALPDYDLAFGVRIMKLMFILLGATMGFVGIAAGCVILLVLLANQESFGVPMLSIQAVKWSAGFPVFRQTPLWRQKLRPRELKAQKERQYPPDARGWDNRGTQE